MKKMLFVHLVLALCVSRGQRLCPTGHRPCRRPVRQGKPMAPSGAYVHHEDRHPGIQGRLYRHRRRGAAVGPGGDARGEAADGTARGRGGGVPEPGPIPQWGGRCGRLDDTGHEDTVRHGQDRRERLHQRGPGDL